MGFDCSRAEKVIRKLMKLKEAQYFLGGKSGKKKGGFGFVTVLDNLGQGCYESSQEFEDDVHKVGKHVCPNAAPRASDRALCFPH